MLRVCIYNDFESDSKLGIWKNKFICNPKDNSWMYPFTKVDKVYHRWSNTHKKPQVGDHYPPDQSLGHKIESPEPSLSNTKLENTLVI